MIRTINEKTSRDLLGRKKIGHLGCVLDDGSPYVVPVSYLYQDGAVFVHSMPGLKISAMRKRPAVCLQTDQVSGDGFSWTSVIAFGEFEEVTDQKDKVRILGLLFKAFPDFTPVEAKLDSEDVTGESVVFRINIRKLTGVCEGS